ncbi:MAG: DUF2807 domain-containing protein [Bacteroidales bacterium]|nr:DUF2807 domain-containing protein [Bacteroidales bacterium]MBN2762427.1 DUF2807 domain-containing protein [Bacteroidales bacterium]
MKTSRIILIATAGFILIVFFIAIQLFRNDVKSLVQKSNLKYQTMPVNDFGKLDFSSRYIVRIRQGRTCSVESTAGANMSLKPAMQNIKGTLFFTMDTTAEEENTDSIYLRITMPTLKEIRASGGAIICMDNFQTDTLLIILENGCVFKGINNTVKHTIFRTSGENQLDIKQTL